MSDIFESVANKYRNTPSALVLWIASLAMVLIGINHFAEDTYSSYAGLLSIEKHFNLTIQAFKWTYWTMSLAPQVAAVIFGYVFLADTRRGWAFWASLLCQAADFLSDLWFRSNGAAFTKLDVTLVSAAITFVFFTVFSEVFTMLGAGLTLKLAPHALHSWKYYRHEIKRVKAQFEKSFSPQPSERPTRRNEEIPDEFEGFMPFGEKSKGNSDKFPTFPKLHSVKSSHRR